MGKTRVDHQVCLAHLIRDVQYAIDAGDAAFAPGVIGLLKRAVGIGRRRQTLTDTTLVLYQSRLQKRLNTLLAITPTTAAGQKLQRIIKRFRQNLFVFITNRAVPPTNNGSEQALRPYVVFRKVTNCFRSAWGAALYADVRSVFETARRRDIPILQAIRLTLEARLLPDGGTPACQHHRPRTKGRDRRRPVGDEDHGQDRRADAQRQQGPPQPQGDAPRYEAPGLASPSHSR